MSMQVFDELRSKWTPDEKREAFRALATDLLTPVNPSESEREAARKKFARRYATQGRSVSVEEFRGSE